MTVTLRMKAQAFHDFTVAASGTRLQTRRLGNLSLDDPAGTAIRRETEHKCE